MRDDVQTGESLIFLISFRREVRGDGLFKAARWAARAAGSARSPSLPLALPQTPVGWREKRSPEGRHERHVPECR